VLRALNFDLECPTPFRALLHAAKFLRWPGRQTVQSAWSLVVDALWLPELACPDARGATPAAMAENAEPESSHHGSEMTKAPSKDHGSVPVISPMATAAAALYLASELTDAGRASNPLAACLPAQPLASSEHSTATVHDAHRSSPNNSTSSSSSTGHRCSRESSDEYHCSSGGASSRPMGSMGSSTVSAAVLGSLREQVGPGRGAAAAGLPWWQALGIGDADMAHVCTLLLKAAAQAEARRAHLEQLQWKIGASSGEDQLPSQQPVSSEQRCALESLLAQLEKLADDPLLSRAPTLDGKRAAAHNSSVEPNTATAEESSAFVVDSEDFRSKRPRSNAEPLTSAYIGTAGLDDSQSFVAAAASAAREILDIDT